MSNLEKMLQVWKNPEESYQKYCKRYGAVTRDEYLEMLLAYEGGSANLTLLRSAIGAEVNGYTEEEARAYSELFDYLGMVAKNMKDCDSVIADLDVFCSNIDETSANDEMERTSISLMDFNFFSVKDNMPIQRALQNGIFFDYVDPSGQPFPVDCTGESYLAFRTQQDFAMFIYKYRENMIAKSEFYDKAYLIAIYLVKNKSKIEDLCMVAPELYTVGRGRLKLGKNSLQTKSLELIEDSGFSDKYCESSGIRFYRANLKDVTEKTQDAILVC